MEFDDNKAIYLQIADGICEQVLRGELKEGERIPSVREWGATIGVNPNTVARSYELLSETGVIFQKRGIGFFVSADARSIIAEEQKKTFIEQELPTFINRAKLLGVPLKDYIL